MSCAKTAEPIEMPFGLWARVDSANHVLGGGPDLPMGMDNFEGEGWPIAKYRELPFMCGGDAACYQITLTTCCY